jgi:hypothetical protein
MVWKLIAVGRLAFGERVKSKFLGPKSAEILTGV